MGIRFILFLISFFFTSFFCLSQNKSNKIEFDSLINYKVEKKETLYSISKKFNTEIQDILLFNSDLKNSKLRKNSIIIIPLKKKIVNKFSVKMSVKSDTILNSNQLKVKKNYIKIAYLAPFKLSSIEIDSIDQVNSFLKEVNLTTISINFYNGILSAIDEINKSKVDVDIDIFDTENKTDQILSIRNNNDFEDYDLIVGPLIKRNFNTFFQNEIKTSSLSPLVYDDINFNSNTINPEASISLKRDKMFEIIDNLILDTQDQCALIISDSLNKESRKKLIERFPLAEVIDLNKTNNSVDPKIIDSLMGVNKENWVFLETKKPNLISSVTSLLNSQISSERKIKLFSTVSNENYDNPNISYEKLGNLNFMYPSNSAPNSSDEFINFQNNYLTKFGKYPDKISIKSYDLMKDLFYRISVSKSLKKSIEIGETKSIQNKFNYIYDNNSGLKNISFFILKHDDFDIIEYQN
mgnify:CR=1 FL=1